MIYIQNVVDNECSTLCLVRYLDSTDRNPVTITNAGKYFAKKLDFKDIKFAAKVKDIYKIEK